MTDNLLAPYRNNRLSPLVAGADLSPDPVNLTAILADTSGSMKGEPMFQLNCGIQKYGRDIAADLVLAGTTLTSLFVFDDHLGARQLTPFAAPSHFDPSWLSATTGTPLCQATITTIDSLIACRDVVRRKFDRDARVSWMFALTDGDSGAVGDRHLAAAAQKAIQVTALEHQIHVFLIGCGDEVDMEFLNCLAQPGRPPKHMRDVKDFANFFRWLHQSQTIKSASLLDDRLRLPHTKKSLNLDSGWEG